MVQWPGATSASASPSAGTSAAVKRSSAFMQGTSAALGGGVSSQNVHSELVLQPASNAVLAAEVRAKRILGIIGFFRIL